MSKKTISVPASKLISEPQYGYSSEYQYSISVPVVEVSAIAHGARRVVRLVSSAGLFQVYHHAGSFFAVMYRGRARQ